MALLIGIDLGTSSLKCVAFDELGQTQGQSRRNYSWNSPREGWLEIHPEGWWVLALDALRETVSQVDPDEVQGIGVCGIMLMPIMLDKDGEIIRTTLSWLDQRVLPDWQWIIDQGLDHVILHATGTKISFSHTPVPLLWVKRNEPADFESIEKIVLAKDYLRYRLTGEILTDITDASGTLLLDNRLGCWNVRLCEALGLPSSILPELARSTQLVGGLLPGIAERIGLRAGIPVVAGCGDGVSTTLGLGVVRPGQLGLIVGTAGVVTSTTPAFVGDDKGRCFLMRHPISDRFYLTTCTNISGEASNWFCRDFFGDNNESYADFNAEASDSPVGSRGLIFLPFLAGSRSPYCNPLARGCFIGLDLKHRRSDFSRAVMEGVAYELRDCYRVLSEVLADNDITIGEVRLSGGIVHNPLWVQILADVLGHSLRLPSATELGALGAAMTVAVGIGLYTDLEQAAERMIQIIDEVEPGSNAVQTLYSEGFDLYQEAYHALVPFFRSLRRWVERSDGFC